MIRGFLSPEAIYNIIITGSNPLSSHVSNPLRTLAVTCAGALTLACGATAASAQPAPEVNQGSGLTTANAVANMSPGWNLGNTLEAIGSGQKPFASSQETAWGNPAATQAVFDGYKAAGFKSVRIPVSWMQYTNADGTIKAAWMARVKQVVDYARKDDLYVIINVHWDGGWLQPTHAAEHDADLLLASFWTQIATAFKDYDDHLLFAGTNEVMVTNVYSPPTPENCAVQTGFNQVFVDAVRATGGNNANRFLVVQGYNTNIDNTLLCGAKLPKDTVADRVMMELHFYDPYDFTLNATGKIWQWGAGATDKAATAPWADEAYVDGQFRKLKTTFVDKGVPVILGEYGAYTKPAYPGMDTYRLSWDRYVTHSAVTHGIVPIYWDTGGLIDRSNGHPKDAAGLDTIVKAAGVKAAGVKAAGSQ